MRFTQLAFVALVSAALSTHAAPIPAAGDGPAALTAPLVDTLVGSDNVNSIDAIADTLGVAQYSTEDNAEDRNALPQQTADNLIGSDGALTTILEGSPIKRATIGQALAQELQDANGDVDQILGATDQIANNVLGVCEENTTAPEALCGAVTTDKSVNKA